MKSILSTKTLSPSQKELFLSSGFNFVEYDAIQIEFIDFEAPKKIENAIFTSQNAVRAFFSSHNVNSCKIENVFCVGDKTKILLEENGQKIKKKTKNASLLTDFIKKNHKNSSFHFFCGNLRREEIPSLLKKDKIDIFEVKTYRTILNLIKLNQNWDGILFFSPSCVQSFISENKMNSSIAFCIGETTASEVKKYNENIIISATTTVESVISKAMKILKNYD